MGKKLPLPIAVGALLFIGIFILDLGYQWGWVFVILGAIGAVYFVFKLIR